MNDFTTSSVVDGAADPAKTGAPDHVEKQMHEGSAEGRNTPRATRKNTGQTMSHARKALDEMQTVSWTIGEKALENYDANCSAMIRLWSDVGRASTLPEATRIQRKFWESQSKVWWRQSSEITGLAGKLAMLPLVSTSRAASRTIQELKGS